MSEQRLFKAGAVARQLNLYLKLGLQLDVLRMLEIIERTDAELFFDAEAFHSLSRKSVSLFATMNRFFVPEEVLINAVVDWAWNRGGGLGNCRQILNQGGFMFSLRWGLIEREFLIRRYGFLFTSEEKSMLENWKVGVSMKRPFLNMCKEDRGLPSVQGNGLLLLSKPPLEFTQAFRNDTPRDMNVQFKLFKLCSREFSYTRKMTLRPEGIYLEFTCSNGEISCGALRTIAGDNTIFEVDSFIGGVIDAGDTITIRIVFYMVGLFQMADEADCFGAQLTTVSPGIIEEIYADLVTP